MNSEETKVVVTGMGAITAVGQNVNEIWEALLKSTNGITTVTSLEMSDYMTKVAGEIKSFKSLSKFDRSTNFLIQAAEEAVQCGGYETLPESTGCVIGTCLGGANSGEKWYRNKLMNQENDPELIKNWRFNSLTENLAGHFHLKGPTYTISTACAAGGNAIGFGADLIKSDIMDVVIVGGADALAHLAVAGFHSLQSLSDRPCRPYSKERDGLSLGEGAGVLILESEQYARRRHSKILGEVLGYGLSADGYHPTAPNPDGSGAARAIQSAMVHSHTPNEIGYINGHGTGTPKNDSSETNAIKVALGESAKKVKISSTKSMIGHLLGGAGSVEGIITIKALQEGIIPPTANFNEKDPKCDLNYIPNHPVKKARLTSGLSNSFAFGGNNCSVLFGNGERNKDRSMATKRKEEKVVITGLNQISSLGENLNDFWLAITSEKESRGKSKIDVTDQTIFAKRELKRMDRFTKITIKNVIAALKDAKYNPETNPERTGVILGTANGTAESLEQFYEPVVNDGALGANPRIFPYTVFNQASGMASMKTKALGVNTTLIDGHASMSSALIAGFEYLRKNDADVIVCVATDTLTENVKEAYRGVKIRDCSQSNPFSKNGLGLSLSEGSVAIVLEKMSHAKKRQAKAYAELKAYNKNFHIESPTDQMNNGFFEVMSQALQNAKLAKGDIDAIIASAPGLHHHDRKEANGINQLFGDLESKPFTTSCKQITGEVMGAADGFHVLAGCLALQSQSLFPFHHSNKLIDEAKTLNLPNKIKENKLQHLLINGTSLTGSNVSLVCSAIS